MTIDVIIVVEVFFLPLPCCLVWDGKCSDAVLIGYHQLHDQEFERLRYRGDAVSSFEGFSLGSPLNRIHRVAREVGTEGRLGAQASVANVGGTWKVRFTTPKPRFYRVLRLCFRTSQIMSTSWLLMYAAVSPLP